MLFDSKIDTLWFSIAAAISDCSAVSNLQSRITAALWFSMAFLRIFFGAGWYLYGPSGQRISQAIVFKYMTNMFQFHAHLGNSGVSSCGSIGPVDII